MSNDSDDDLPRRRMAVCPHCGGQNAMTATVCRHCMGLFMTISNTDPKGSIWSQGDVYACMVNNPRKLKVVIVMWLWWGPWVLLSAIGCVVAVIAMFEDWLAGLATLLFSAPCLWLFGTMLYRTTRNYFRHRNTSS